MVLFNILSYLATDLFGKSLTDDDDEFVREFLIQEVAKIGIQMVRCFVGDIYHGFSVTSVIKLSALEHIHSYGIVHRDIKPQNLLSCDGTDFSHLYVIDFGLARRRLSGKPGEVDLVKERISVVGSLNAYNGLGGFIFSATESTPLIYYQI